ncbi:hypothetical protein L596_023732 [Steinernema carpocapsae]|uniref:Hexosyltransferase n=1 Tax=Steinernema carpocapsae TaxID=34508 RepID=A0A4U5MEJ2_STECR|nr:hypothetical protein L596_023732 [Steinernema carpocapsae]
MRLQWVLRNFWKYAAVVSLFFLTVDIVFLRPKEVVRLSDSEQTQEILDSFSSPNVKNESAGQFLGKDWTIDIGTRRLFARKNPKCGKTVELLIGVISHANETQMRRDVRNSWASKTSYNTSFTQILFLVGRTENSTCTTAEALEFNDIIYVDVNESYYNLSMKTYALLRYQREFCLQARCTLKIDSDVVANVAGMERLCRSQNDTPVVTGHCKNEWLPLMREVESKYYVPRFIYAQDNYPPYCYGAAYMYSGHRVADLFLDAVPQTPFLRSENFRRLSEDTIFTGLLRTLVDVPLQNNIGFSVYQDDYSYWCPDGQSPTPLVFHGSKEPIPEWEKMRKDRNGSTSLWSPQRWRRCGFRGTKYSRNE